MRLTKRLPDGQAVMDCEGCKLRKRSCSAFRCRNRLKDELAKYEDAKAVPVVRCKDCVYRDGTPGQPNIICHQMHDDDFCSYGQRKETDGEQKD